MSNCNCNSGSCAPELALAAAAAVASLAAAAAPPPPPADAPGPKPQARWLEGLLKPDARKVYSGPELETIGMPCGGIAAGQLYVRGDGTLAHWLIFNNVKNTGYGDKCYRTYRPESPVDQGFAIRIKAPDAPPIVRKLNRDEFDAIEFIGEYPIAEVRYRTRSKPALPVEVAAEIFSPFIPLLARDSAMPVTILRYTVKNPANHPVEVSLAGWLQNAVCLEMAGVPGVLSRNRIVHDQHMTTVRMDLVEAPVPLPKEEQRITVFEDFEGANYGAWTAAGQAFGPAPATGTFPAQQRVSGFRGKGLVNTFRPDDRPQGTLTSKPFKITEPFIAFLIGGGKHAGTTCMNLLIDGKVVRTATGADNEALRLSSWNVGEFVGREAQLQIVDKESGPWGHINVDYIHFTNLPPGRSPGLPVGDPGFGDMSLTALDPAATACAAWTSEEAFLKDLADDGKLAAGDESPYLLGQKRCAAVASAATLAAGESRTFTFVVSWYFPQRKDVGNMYANFFSGSVGAASYVAQNFDRLSRETHLFRDTYFDTTLPYWLAARLMMPVSILATETCQWWKNGRFYAWEGVGCCHGTCTHVWNYEHAGARLFPELERSTRLMQDLGAGFNPETGLIGFRSDKAYAADGQAGSVLKVYREHLMSADRGFLDAAWPNVKKAIEFLIKHDANGDGIIEDVQHNTFDINFLGPNTFVGSLYLAALRAAEEMARLKGENDLAGRYHAIYEKGRAFTMEKLFNGEYFIQIIPPNTPDKHQYGNGCLADQVFGQGWAHQVNLGYIYPQESVLAALKSVFKHNWTTDVGPYNKVYPPQRWFARPGDAGLFTCTWPKGGRPAEPVLYRDEVWTGIEYQVANHMLYEGMITEAFALVRGVHDRYDGAKHNPWNEVECGDHYARAMASWGCLLSVSGFVYDGPAGRIGFAPRLTPENFKAFFTAAEGWGTLSQKRQGGTQTNRFEIKWGKLRAQTLVFELPEGMKATQATLTLAGQALACRQQQEGSRLTLSIAHPVTVERGQSIEVVLR